MENGLNTNNTGLGAVFQALVAYLDLLQRKSMYYSSPGYDGPAKFMELTCEVAGNLVVYRDGFAQRLDLDSQWRTLRWFRYDPWPGTPRSAAA